MNRILDAALPAGKPGQAVKQSEMKKITRTEVIIIESETTLVLRLGEPLRGWCARCGCETVMLTLEMAASLAGVTTRLIYERLEEGALHFQELPDGRPLICGNSVGPESTKTKEAEKENETS